MAVVSPKSAISLARGGFGAHLLDLKSIVRLREKSLADLNRHAPRRRGIQYAVTYRSIYQRFGVLDRPVKPGDDDRVYPYNGSSSLPWLSRFGVAMSPSSWSSSSTGARSGFFGLSVAGFEGSCFFPVPPM